MWLRKRKRMMKCCLKRQLNSRRRWLGTMFWSFYSVRTTYREGENVCQRKMLYWPSSESEMVLFYRSCFKAMKVATCWFFQRTLWIMKITLSVKYQKITVIVRLEKLYHIIERGQRGEGMPMPAPRTICSTKNRAYSNQTSHSKFSQRLMQFKEAWVVSQRKPFSQLQVLALIYWSQMETKTQEKKKVQKMMKVRRRTVLKASSRSCIPLTAKTISSLMVWNISILEQISSFQKPISTWPMSQSMMISTSRSIAKQQIMQLRKSWDNDTMASSLSYLSTLHLMKMMSIRGRQVLRYWLTWLKGTWLAKEGETRDIMKMVNRLLRKEQQMVTKRVKFHNRQVLELILMVSTYSSTRACHQSDRYSYQGMYCSCQISIMVLLVSIIITYPDHNRGRGGQEQKGYLRFIQRVILHYRSIPSSGYWTF